MSAKAMLLTSSLLLALSACADKGSADPEDDDGRPTDSGATAGDGGSSGDGGDGGTDTGTDGGTEPPAPPTITAIEGDGGVIDPLRGDPLELSALVNDQGVDVTLDAVITDADGNLILTLADDVAPEVGDDFSEAALALSWDGRDNDGEPAAVGTYTVTWTLQDGDDVYEDASQSLYVVRTGLTSGLWGASDAEGDERFALLWHNAVGASPYWNDGAADYAFRFDKDALPEDGLAKGGTAPGGEETAVNVPEVYADLATPPNGWADVNLPTAYAYDARPSLTLQLDNDLGNAAEAATWTASIDGWELIDGSVADGSLTFQKTDALSETVGVSEGSLDLVLQAGEQAVSTQAIPYRIYRVIGAATFASTDSPHMAWTQSIDEALRGIEGTAAKDADVLSALVAWVFDENELRYDTRSGASFYMSYSGGWDGGRINFRGFMNRSNGSVVNCSDCSGIMGVFANMLGVPLDYSIILSSFQLNEILAIGGDDYTSCPFGPTSCGFSYHAVTTNDLSENIWDATLALDGDKDPGSEPSTELLVQEITGAEYLERLVRSGSAGYYYDDSRVRIQ